MKTFARHALRATAWLAGALLVTACQSQGEGERCDKMNFNADCASGLMCGDSFACCVPGSAACNSTGMTGGSGAAGSSGSDAATDGSSTMTSEAATGEGATSEAATSEAATMSGETGAEGGPATPDAADGAAE